jgi:hypothetical protein
MAETEFSLLLIWVWQIAQDCRLLGRLSKLSTKTGDLASFRTQRRRASIDRLIVKFNQPPLFLNSNFTKAYHYQMVRQLEPAWVSCLAIG